MKKDETAQSSFGNAEHHASGAIRPIPTFQSILARGRSQAANGDDIVTLKYDDLVGLLRRFVGQAPFDAELYFARYPDLRDAKRTGIIKSARSHWVQYGYF